MIKNLGKFAHPKKKASFMAKRGTDLTPIIGSNKSLPAPPKSKPDPVNMAVQDVSMTGATPATGAMPMGTIKPNLAARPAGPGTAKTPGKKKLTKPPVHKRAKRATVPFFGGY
jgi:hypothetical protein